MEEIRKTQDSAAAQYEICSFQKIMLNHRHLLHNAEIHTRQNVKELYSVSIVNKGGKITCLVTVCISLTIV